MMPNNLTIKDIARKSGFSVSTVSRVLNNHPDVSREAKDAVTRVVKEHHFILNNTARLLKQQSSKNILIIAKGTNNLFFSKIVEKMQEMISGYGFNAVVHFLDEDSDEVRLAIQLCRERKPLGLIFLGGSLENFQRGFAHITPPAVLTTTLNEKLSFENLSSVGINDTLAAAKAIEYLLTCGHRRIGIIGGNLKLSYISQQRYDGCLQSFERYGQDFDPDCYQKASYHFDSAYRAVKKLLTRHPDLTAIFCMSDVMAIGAMRALADMAIRVPDDISVIGFDGIELGQFYNPRLTTIAQPHMELAEASVNLLIANIEQQDEAKIITLDVSLTEGESVRRLTT